MSFHVGEDLGDYKITALIGAGSMGRVFQVEHRLTKRIEAVKVLSAELATPVQIQRFEREIAVQARLSHPNIATVHNAFSWKGCLVMVTEFLEGQTLEKLLSQGRLPIETGVGYIRQVLSALSYAHDRGVVHRDVTPANLVITTAGVVKLTDFGVSKSFGDIQLTNCGDIIGSLEYMAPEQARGGAHPDLRSDLYSVGAILYQILTGKKPFGDVRPFAPMVTDSEADPPPPTDVAPFLPQEWNEVVGKALIRDRTRRYSKASEFLHAVERTARATGVLPSGKLQQWRPWLTGVGIAAALLLWLGLPAMNRFGQVSRPPEIVFPIAVPEIAPPRPALPAGRKIEPPRRNTMARPVARRTLHAPRRTGIRQAHSLVTPQPGEPLSRPLPVAPAKPLQSAVILPPSPPLNAPEPDLRPPIEPPTTQSGERTAPHKRAFWNKLNPFKKKADPVGEDSPSQ